MPEDFATRRHRHGRRTTATLVVAAVTAPVLVAGAVAAGGPTDGRPVAIEAPGSPPRSPTGAVTPEFAPFSPGPATSPPPAPSTEASPTPGTPSATARPGFPTTSPAPVPDETVSPAPPVATPAPAGLPHAAPVRIEVPDVGIASDLVDLGLNPDGSLEVPQDYDLAGWYADGPAPGDDRAPPAVIVGHVDSTTGPAVFHRLRELEPGQEVLVTREDGSVAVFRVRDTRQYSKAALPTDEVYAPRAPSELVLITCSGAFDREARSYLDNFVVTARLDPEASTAT